jgi:hypothetical protein
MASIEKFLPIKIQTPNIKEHWAKTYKRRCDQRFWIQYFFNFFPNFKPTLPCIVTLTRSGYPLDYDNYVYSLKAIRDALAEKITGNTCPGRADGNKEISWIYEQKYGKSGLNIKIENL